MNKKNKDTNTKLIGKRGHAEIVQIFAAVANTELNEGSGNEIDISYHETKREAEIASIGRDVMGSDGEVQPRLAVRFDDGTTLLLACNEWTFDFVIPAEGTPTVKFTKPTSEQFEKAALQEK